MNQNHRIKDHLIAVLLLLIPVSAYAQLTASLSGHWVIMIMANLAMERPTAVWCLRRRRC
jgi:hypothetical protein